MNGVTFGNDMAKHIQMKEPRHSDMRKSHDVYLRDVGPNEPIMDPKLITRHSTSHRNQIFEPSHLGHTPVPSAQMVHSEFHPGAIKEEI